MGIDEQALQSSAASKRRVEIVNAHVKERRRSAVLSVALPLVLGIIGVTYWQVNTSGGTAGSVLIPSFTDFMHGSYRLLLDASFWSAAWTSEKAIIVGFGLAAITAVPTGILIGQLPKVDAMVAGWLDISVVTPTAIFMPIVLIVFGPTFSARVCVIFIFAFPFIALPCRTGSLIASEALMGMSRSFGAKEYQVWRDTLIPSALPSIVAGLRQGLAHSFTGMFLVELIYLTVGLGMKIQGYQAAFDTARTFGVCFLIVAEAALLMAAMKRLENRVGG